MRALKDQIFFLEELNLHISSGNSTNLYVKDVLKRDHCSDFIRKGLGVLIENPSYKLPKLSKSSLNADFWSLIQSGLNAEPIADELNVLLETFREQQKCEYEKKIALLPVIMSLFLLFFIFPAYMFLLVGPVLSSLTNF